MDSKEKSYSGIVKKPLLSKTNNESKPSFTKSF